MQETIQARFIDTDDSQLYLCQHDPAVKADVCKTILICNSYGHEYERCHRALRQLAVQLARAGHYAFRFDYTGTGDSSGDSDTASPETWMLDIGALIDHAKKTTGADQIILIGLRLGATLAARLSSERDDIEALVLYSPVTDHKSLLDEWRREHSKFFRKHSQAEYTHSDDEILGYPVGDRLRKQMEQSLYLPERIQSADRILLLYDNGERESGSDAEMHLAGISRKVTAEIHDDIAVWKREPFDAIVPFKLIRRIVGWVGEC